VTQTGFRQLYLFLQVLDNLVNVRGPLRRLGLSPHGDRPASLLGRDAGQVVGQLVRAVRGHRAGAVFTCVGRETLLGADRTGMALVAPRPVENAEVLLARSIVATIVCVSENGSENNESSDDSQHCEPRPPLKRDEKIDRATASNHHNLGTQGRP